MNLSRNRFARFGGGMKTEDAVRMWQDEHARFARLLDFLDVQMMAFHEGGHPNYELMRDVIYYLQHYADRYHHPREDVAFALLLERPRRARDGVGEFYSLAHFIRSSTCHCIHS
jgi:hemerythrin-like domain-containing protein